jgi:hypothetical protein
MSFERPTVEVGEANVTCNLPIIPSECDKR